MKQQWLKYTLVVLAIIASIGLLWADSIATDSISHGTYPVDSQAITVKTDSLLKDSIFPTAPRNISVTLKIEKPYTNKKSYSFRRFLDDVKNYKGDILFIFLIIVLVANTICVMIDNKSHKKEDAKISDGDNCKCKDSELSHPLQSLVLVGTITLCVYSNSSWCYLALVAIILIYLSRKNPKLIEDIGRAVGALHGNVIPTENAKPLETDKKILNKIDSNLEANVQDTKRPVKPELSLGERLGQNQSLSEFIRENITKSKKAEEVVMGMLRVEYPKMETQRVINVNGKRIILDGLIQGQHENVIVEVIYQRYPNSVYVSGLQNLLEAKNYIQTHTHKATFIWLYIITDNKEKKQKLTEKYDTSYFNLQYNTKIFTFDEVENMHKARLIMTTDYAKFMSSVCWDDLNTMEKQALFEAAHGKLNEKGVPFAVKKGSHNNEDVVLLSYIGSSTILMLDQKGRKDFPKWLEDTYMNKEDGYSYLSFLAAMEKDD